MHAGRATRGLFLAGMLLGTPVHAAEAVSLISVGSSSANGWPSYVAIDKGFFAAAGLEPEVLFAQSNSARRAGCPA